MLFTAGPLFFGFMFATEIMSPQYFDRPETPAVLLYENLLILISILIAFLSVHGYLLATRGQTVGKVLMKTKIVHHNTGNLVPLLPLFLKRYLLLWLLIEIPVFGGFLNLANAMMIFRENKKCLHDEMAGTKVVTLKRRHNQRELPSKIEVPNFD